MKAMILKEPRTLLTLAEVPDPIPRPRPNPDPGP